jgi:hypothetical protein
MSVDLKGWLDVIGQYLSDLLKLLPTANGFLTFALVCLIAAALVKSSIGKRARLSLEETMFSNWRLALLGATGLVLSVASGYTTWDGMRNFTGESLLSAMVTFGIQGVMLIVAWLIGESFATGMSNVVTTDGVTTKSADQYVGMILGGMLVGVLFYYLMVTFGGITWTKGIGSGIDVAKASNIMMYFAMAALVIGILMVSRGELSMPYVQSTRVIIKNAVLWVMFFACMATSVFFSFNSLFSAIFPQNERVRAAEIRAQNQVAGILADISGVMTERQLSQAEELFKSQGWEGYDKVLTNLANQSQGSAREIEDYFVKQMEDRRRGIAQQQERIATAQSGQAGMIGRKTSLTEELARIKADRPGLSAEFQNHKSELDTKAKEVDAKRIEALAEEKGVEGSLKLGKGQNYRLRMSELGTMQDAYKIKEERTKDAQKRLQVVESRIAQIDRELANLDGDIAKLKGEASTAESRIKVAEETKGTEEGPKVDPSRIIPEFERARAEFRQLPDIDRLSKVQVLCTQLYGGMMSTPSTKEKVRGIDCDPKQAAEAASNLFTLNAGMKQFAAGCAGGDRLNEHKTTDALFGFARKCLSDSGLPSKDTDVLRTKINFIDLSRDDKAHPFVVTINAFQDGNRLAYLALAIAIAMDSLVFMSGLFGANAIRSPLSDVPSPKARTASQLEAIIENALLPDTFENARTTLNAMRPITPQDGYIAEVMMNGDGSGNSSVMSVLNAGATIGAVARDANNRERYLVRAELFEFLSVVAKKAFEGDKDMVKLAKLEKDIAVALQPDVKANAEVVQDHLQPISFTDGDSAKIELADGQNADAARVLRKFLNAGAMHKKVRNDQTNSKAFYVHSDLVRTLSNIQARHMESGSYAQLGGPSAARTALQGGSLNPDRSPRVIVGPNPATVRLEGPVAGVTAVQPQRPIVRAVNDTARDTGRAAALSPEHMYAEYYAELLAAVDLDAERLTHIADPRVADMAGQASADLKQLVERLPRLKRRVMLHTTDFKARLTGGYNTLWSRVGESEAKLLQLNRAYETVTHYLPALTLRTMLTDLIGELEVAATPDDGISDLEQRFLNKLREIRNTLDGMDQRNELGNEQAWQRLGRMIDGQEAGAPPLTAAIQPLKRA